MLMKMHAGDIHSNELTHFCMYINICACVYLLYLPNSHLAELLFHIMEEWSTLNVNTWENAVFCLGTLNVIIVHISKVKSIKKTSK